MSQELDEDQIPYKSQYHSGQYFLKERKKQEKYIFTNNFTIFSIFYLYRFSFPSGIFFFQSKVLPLQV